MSDGRLCTHCGLWPATVKWVGTGGTLAMAHGFYEWWCERCALEVQIAYAKQAVSRVSQLQEKLDALQATSSPPESGSEGGRG